MELKYNCLRENLAQEEFKTKYSTEVEVSISQSEKKKTVAICFENTLVDFSSRSILIKNKKPYLEAVWALKVFKYNLWDVYIFSPRIKVSKIQEWINENCSDLINHVIDYNYLGRKGIGV